MPITALPAAPSRSSSPTTFSNDMDALLTALPPFVTEANTLQTDVNTKQATASTAATTATTQAGLASTSASNASTSASTATTQASAASTSASNAATSATNANNSAVAAAISAATINLTAPGPIGGTTPNTGAFTTLSASGNATFSGTSRRVIGDMSNADPVNRVTFQTSTANSGTIVQAMPAGTSKNASFQAHNTSTLTDSHPYAEFGTANSGTEVRMSSAIYGAATYLPVTYYVSNVEYMRALITGALQFTYGAAAVGVIRRVGSDYESQGTITNPVDRSFIHDYRPLGTVHGGSAPFSADGANTFIGHSAGNFTMAPNNTAVGDYNIHCSYNAAIGTQALGLLTTGYNNAGCGVNTLRYNTEGYSNSALGRDCMEVNTTGSFNTAAGQSALHNNTIGVGNVAVGGKAGFDNLSGNYNTYIGFSDSGTGITTGSHNVIIGRVAGLSSSLANNLRIGDGQGNLWLTGDSSGNITSPRGAIGYSTGAGGTVTQVTSKATAVTLNKACGTITMDATSLAATTTVAFLLTNSFIADDDIVVVSLDFNSTSYQTWSYRSNAGSANIALRNISAGALAEAVVLKFVVVKGAAA